MLFESRRRKPNGSSEQGRKYIVLLLYCSVLFFHASTPTPILENHLFNCYRKYCPSPPPKSGRSRVTCKLSMSIFWRVIWGLRKKWQLIALTPTQTTNIVETNFFLWKKHADNKWESLYLQLIYISAPHFCRLLTSPDQRNTHTDTVYNSGKGSGFDVSDDVFLELTHTM